MDGLIDIYISDNMLSMLFFLPKMMTRPYGIKKTLLYYKQKTKNVTEMNGDLPWDLPNVLVLVWIKCLATY